MTNVQARYFQASMFTLATVGFTLGACTGERWPVLSGFAAGFTFLVSLRLWLHFLPAAYAEATHDAMGYVFDWIKAETDWHPGWEPDMPVAYQDQLKVGLKKTGAAAPTDGVVISQTNDRMMHLALEMQPVVRSHDDNRFDLVWNSPAGVRALGRRIREARLDGFIGRRTDN